MTATLYTESPTVNRRLRTYTANGYSFQMVQVEKGRFRMGDDDSEYEAEKPAHWVNIANDFELGQYPVTQGLWEAVMGENPAYFKGAEHPVEDVSWDDIMGTERGKKQDKAKEGFLDRLNALPEIEERNAADGCRFGLPSEVQWEFAACGGRYGQALDYKYAGSNYLPEVGWYNGNSQGQTHPVGHKRLNVLGLYDMSGNVEEWCVDVRHDSYQGAPEDGSVWIKDGDANIRVVRGGSWLNDDLSCLPSVRSWDSSDDRDSDIGFRLARYRVTL